MKIPKLKDLLIILPSIFKYYRLSKLFDPAFYSVVYPDIGKNKLNPIIHFVQYGSREGRNPNPLFDPVFYRKRYMGPDEKEEPLLHYLKQRGELVDPHPLFDAEYYADQLDNPRIRITFLEHYLKYGWKEGLSPSPHFDPSFYLAGNPDVANAKIDPLVHYLTYGENEGRSPNPYFFPHLFVKPFRKKEENYAAYMAKTKLAFFAEGNIKSNLGFQQFKKRFLQHADSAPIVLFVSHEASRTGAPLIILELSRQMKKQFDIIPVHLLLNGGEISPDFDVTGPTYVSKFFFTDVQKFENEIHTLLALITEFNPVGAIVNSAESRRVLPLLKKEELNVISLIHEMAEFYPEDEWQNISKYSDQIIFPSQIVREQAVGNTKFDPGKLRVRGQGLLNEQILNADKESAQRKIRTELGLEPDSIIVLGCGTAVPRKGVDLFASIGISFFNNFSTDRKIYFVWLGGLTKNEHYYWAKKDVERSGFEEFILFPGPTKDTTSYFAGSDIFLMTSRADPFPCVIHEAMAAGLPIISFDKGGGYTEALSGGAGIVLPYGDIISCVAKIEWLINEKKHREELGQAAVEKVTNHYRFKDYSGDIAHFLLETADPANKKLRVFEEKVEQFQKDNSDVSILNKKGRVVFTVPDWWISGVNTFIENLVRELNKLDYDAYILFTTNTSLYEEESLMPGVPYRFLTSSDQSYKTIWTKLKQHLESGDACVFVPNYDYVASAISADLDSKVGILGVLHSDDQEHYEHAYRLGPYWNNIVSVSKRINDHLINLNPGFKEKATSIYYGVNSPDSAGKPKKRETFSIVYTGRVIQFQKRILDFIPIIEKLSSSGLDFILTIIGDGPELPTLKKELQKYLEKGSVRLLGRQNREVIFNELGKSHVFALTSDFEGLPISLLEALSMYCIPVVTDIKSGVGEIIESGKNGFISPIGDSDAFVDNLLTLARDPELRNVMAQQAFSTLDKYNLRVEQMARKYDEVLQKIFEEITSGEYTRPKALTFKSEMGNILLPPMLQKSIQ